MSATDDPSLATDMAKVRVRSLQRAAETSFDCIVIGGGIHGASVLRELSLRGYKSLLLEATDYGFGTSSRSSKLLHGGVRYLQQGNVSLVREALIERNIVMASAPHLTRALPFLFPVLPKLTPPAWQLRIGLTLYDLLASTSPSVSDRFQSHERIASADLRVNALRKAGLQTATVFRYDDGQMDDARLVLENILDAEQLGATAINHLGVGAIRRINDPRARWLVSGRCEQSGEQIECRSRFLVNTSGPWLPTIQRMIEPWRNGLWPTPQFSRGTHLLFDAPFLPELSDPTGVILPTGEAGRYYFVLPFLAVGRTSHQHLTLVGTTDRLVGSNEQNPIANEIEIEELLGYLRRDLPHSALTRSRLYRTFCGMRILAGSGGKRASELSRSESILEGEGYIGLLGGKYTTARHTAERMAGKVNLALDRRSKQREFDRSSKTRPLPGGRGWSKHAYEQLVTRLADHFRSANPGLTLTENQPRYRAYAESAVNRLGTRAELLLSERYLPFHKFQESTLPVLRSEIQLSIQEEHACTVQDILWRRLGVALQPGDLSALRAEIETQLTLAGHSRKTSDERAEELP